ncbi:hypothetical protein GT204_07785 [Streptomyces sp. SID4919]|uniref:hypothetical protein n=1 Tax=unclassified Streptomyces TaxID=2593676 RepID=UPI0008238DF4|nr:MULTISPECIES: hypothetical protein [unclassified Streptomyces]MYY08806.1 hypothetical protein [Streptomyces sp. SID4919]SCK25415.1 hypothetical protein YW7DRAFT_01940 [Streptomyces sp. AmelKG-E11A]
MTPAAALAVVRAAVQTAHGHDLRHPDDIAEQIVDELTAQGWTITRTDPTPSPRSDQPTPM